MEKTSPSKKQPMDLARESLIAISSSVPENVAEAGPESVKTANASPLPKADSAEKYRSNLMSISLQSPEPNGLPLPNGDSAEKYRSELISISQQLPEPKGLPLPNDDSAERYRSELMSISQQSPGPKGLPAIGNPLDSRLT